MILGTLKELNVNEDGGVFQFITLDVVAVSTISKNSRLRTLAFIIYYWY